jgi:tetratricopeptide (TPR) repeat protein
MNELPGVPDSRSRRSRAAALAMACSLALALPATSAVAAVPGAEAAVTRGNELLSAGDYEAAREAFSEALEGDPSSVEAHLGRARAYYAMGEYARARIEFEAVLGYDLSLVAPDLQTLGAIYEGVAEDYAAGRTWSPFYYAETGIGNYRQNSSKSTDIFGGAGDYDTFLPIRVGGGWGTPLTERHSFNGTLDYRFRWYDDKDRRNDSDLRWNVNLSRPVDDDNLRFGMRGRTSYRGDGRYRNDWGAFATYSVGFGENDRLALTGEVRERRYPRGPLRSRTRDIAELTANWTHSLANGKTALSLGGSIAQEWATQERIDGDASIWSVRSSLDHTFSDTLDAFFFLEYWNEAYDDERPDFTTDPDLLVQRTDDLVYAGGGLVWAFARGWSLRPTIQYDWEDSNVPALTYSKTEAWVTVRKSF